MFYDDHGALLFALHIDGIIMWAATGFKEYWEPVSNHVMSDSESDSDTKTETEDKTVYYGKYNSVGLGSGEV
jgi:hypothetical protein